MIRPKKTIGIVYCGNSIKYKNELRKIITEYRNNGYCIQCEVVDGEEDEQEKMIEKRVINVLNRFDYGMVFLTKDLFIQNENHVFLSKPNVLFELGYLRGRLHQDHTLCITDFPHSEIDNKIYMMPSDIIGERIEPIDKKNYKSDLKTLFDKFIRSNRKVIVKLDNYNVNNLISSLILNPGYKTDYKELFTASQLNAIEKYSLKWQFTEIFGLWQKEKTKLCEEEQIIYLFERIVFLPFFPEEFVEGHLNSFLSVKVDKEDGYLFACYQILKRIGEYLSYKKSRNSYESASYYFNKAKEIECGLQVFEKQETAPIIQCVSENYIGLCLLNSYRASKELDEKTQKHREQLEIAERKFELVLKLSRENLCDSVEVFQSFAWYNLARVRWELGKDAESEYSMAQQKREDLSKIHDFPENFRVNFSLERIHTEIDYYDYLKEKEKIRLEQYREKIKILNGELEMIKQTPAAEVSLFKTLEDKLLKKAV